MTTPEDTEIKTCDLSFRWIDGYWDGIMSGFAIWRGSLCYFEMCDEIDSRRKFTVHSLSDEEAKKAIRNYEDSKDLHGDHNDLLPDGSSAGGTCRTTIEDVAAAGDAIAAAMEAGTWEPPISFRLNPIVGWFASATF